MIQEIQFEKQIHEFEGLLDAKTLHGDLLYITLRQQSLNNAGKLLQR